ncbi:MAG: response regulator [Kiritimatiellia bacterium]
MSDTCKPHILLIDDEEHLLVTLRDYLAYEGFEVSLCRSAEEALAQMPKLRPDLIILDICMPGIGGLGFLKALAEDKTRKTCPVLVLTARANLGQFFDNLDVAGFLAKPCSRTDLMREIRRILGQQPPPVDEKPEAVHWKVLLADDNSVRAAGAKALLERDGFEVQIADSGPAVLELAQTQRPHAIVIKTVLPGMNGDIVAALLKAMPSTKKIPLILFRDPECDTTSTEGRLRIPHGVECFLRTSDEYALLKAVRDAVGT